MTLLLYDFWVPLLITVIVFMRREALVIEAKSVLYTRFNIFFTNL